MSKHTPGPWAVEGIEIEDADNCLVARIYHPTYVDGQDCSLANAHLIAAAPAMYAESKTLCSLVRAFMNDNRLYDGQLIQAIHNLETALAQAERRTL